MAYIPPPRAVLKNYNFPNDNDPATIHIKYKVEDIDREITRLKGLYNLFLMASNMPTVHSLEEHIDALENWKKDLIRHYEAEHKDLYTGYHSVSEQHNDGCFSSESCVLQSNQTSLQGLDLATAITVPYIPIHNVEEDIIDIHKIRNRVQRNVEKAKTQFKTIEVEQKDIYCINCIHMGPKMDNRIVCKYDAYDETKTTASFCEEKNKDKHCKDYEKKLWKFWIKD